MPNIGSDERIPGQSVSLGTRGAKTRNDHFEYVNSPDLSAVSRLTANYTQDHPASTGLECSHSRRTGEVGCGATHSRTGSDGRFPHRGERDA